MHDDRLVNTGAMVDSWLGSELRAASHPAQRALPVRFRLAKGEPAYRLPAQILNSSRRESGASGALGHKPGYVTLFAHDSHRRQGDRVYPGAVARDRTERNEHRALETGMSYALYVPYRSKAGEACESAARRASAASGAHGLYRHVACRVLVRAIELRDGVRDANVADGAHE